MSLKFNNHSSIIFLVEFFLALSCLSVQLEAQLRVGFYCNSCPSAERIVKEEVVKAYINDKGIAPGLVRMHFHDCFVRGCDGSVLIDSTSSNTAEKDSPANNPSLRGFEVIDNAKTRLEAECKGVVSCADILAFAARDSVAMTRGQRYDVPSGRRDGNISSVSEVQQNIPAFTFNVDELIQSFAKKNLTQEEMVTLSGAHTIGRSHCSPAINNRIYKFNGTNGPDPTLDPKYAEQLQQQCPEGSTNSGLVVAMDPNSQFVADINYYKDILANRVLFTSDQTLLTNSNTANEVNQNAGNQFLWMRKFAAAMVKMGQIEVLTGTDGEIRANCRVTNN